MDSPRVTDLACGITEAEKSAKKHDYKAALSLYEQLFNVNPIDEKICLGYACSQLATGHTSQAQKTFTFLLENLPDASFLGRAQAQLVLGFLADALKNIESALIHGPQTRHMYFMAAVTCYTSGFIGHVYQHLNAAVKKGYEWIDDDPSDILVQHILSKEEFTDLEQIYLDVLDEIGDRKGQNRWFYINMPVFDLLSASNSRQKVNADKLIQLLAPKQKVKFTGRGHQTLEGILGDFARSEIDAQFGLEVQKEFKAGNIPQVARLLLGLLLLHIKQFASFLGLTPELIDQSHLQTLIRYLPYTIAVDLLLLYSLSEPRDKPATMQKKMDIDISSGLIAACLDNFYHSVDHYRKTEKSPPS